MRVVYINGPARCNSGWATNTRIRWKCMFRFVLQRSGRNCLVHAHAWVIAVYGSALMNMAQCNWNVTSTQHQQYRQKISWKTGSQCVVFLLTNFDTVEVFRTTPCKLRRQKWCQDHSQCSQVPLFCQKLLIYCLRRAKWQADQRNILRWNDYWGKCLFSIGSM